jgi:sulfide:quinone oxidoreductase
VRPAPDGARGRRGDPLDMLACTAATGDPLRVVIAGGGVGGLETLVALRGLAGDRVAPVLVAPEDAFELRALDVFEPFGFGARRHHPLGDIARELRAERHRDRLARVDAARREVRLRSGATIAYDVLVLAAGAVPYPAFDHGVLFDRDRGADGFDALLRDLRGGRARSAAVVVPRGATWVLPAYELALLLAAFGAADGAPGPAITLVTAENEPLQAFGAPAGEMIRAELAAAGVDLIHGVAAGVPSARIVELRPGRRLHVDRVVHLPLLAGPRIAGVPADPAGFVLVDDAFRAGGDPHAFAVGDGTAGVYKQGGLAAQQADLVARAIASRTGAVRAPGRYAPVFRGVLRTPHGPRYLRAEPPGGEGRCLVSGECLWWPAAKVASRWLIPWLAAREVRLPAAPRPRVLPRGDISRRSLSTPTRK